MTVETGLTRSKEHVAKLHTPIKGYGTYDFGKGSTNVNTLLTESGQPVTARFTLPVEGQYSSGDTATKAAMESSEGSGGTWNDTAMQSGDGSAGTSSDTTMPSGDTATDATLELGDGSSRDMAKGNAAGSMMPEVMVGGARIQGYTSTLPRVVVEQDGHDE